MVKLSSLKVGDFFTLTDCSDSLQSGISVPSSKVYIRGNYERSSKRYSCTRFDDINSERFFPGDKFVCPSVDFLF